MQAHRVQTDIYTGPLGLLLFLIRRNEIDIHDLPVALVARQYVEYVDMLQAIDPNVAGDFLIMIAVLMELKSKMLLPRPETAGDEVEEDFSDPRLELVRQLLEYKRFKDASTQLHDLAETQVAKWPRIPAKLPGNAPAVDLDEVQIWDLVAAFNRVMASIGAGAATHNVVLDDTPISEHAADIVDQLDRAGGRLRFERVFEGRTRGELIGLFMALLELMRQARIRVSQERPFDAIDIELLSAAPIQVGGEWGETFERAVLGTNDATADDVADRDALAPDPSIASRLNLDEPDDDLEDEAFRELDAIKTDIDVDAVLRTARGEDDTDETNE